MKKVLIALLISPSLWATNGYIQSKSCAAGANSIACAFTSNITAGNSVIAMCAAGTSPGTMSITDNNSGVYTNIMPTKRSVNGIGLTTAILAWAPNHPAGATTVTCSSLGNTHIQVEIHEYASSTTAGGFDVSSDSEPAATVPNPYSNAINTRYFNEFVFNGEMNAGSSGSVPSGTIRNNSANQYFATTQDIILANPTNGYVSTLTATGVNGWISVQAAFCPAGGCVQPGLYITP